MAVKKKTPEKTLQNSIETNFPTKIVTEDYDMITFKRKPVSVEYLKELAREMLEWVNNFKDEDGDAPLKHSQFLGKKGIHKYTYYRWLEACPELKFAHDHTLMIIGDNRELGGIKRRLDPNMVTKSMPMYDESWKQLEEWRAKMGDGKNVGNITVRMEQFSDEEEEKDDKEKIDRVASE